MTPWVPLCELPTQVVHEDVAQDQEKLEEKLGEKCCEAVEPSTDEPNLTDGTCVRIQGLQRVPTLNGTSGLVQGFDEASRRYMVRIEDGSTKKLRRENLALSCVLQVSTSGHGQPPEVEAGDSWDGGLEGVLQAAFLAHHGDAAREWCRGHGAEYLDEVLDYFEDLADYLFLKPDQKESFRAKLLSANTAAQDTLHLQQNHPTQR